MIKKILHSTSLKANIIANFTGNGITALISFISVPVFLRYLGPEGYGLIGIFATLQVVLSLLDSGLSTTLNKELARLSVLKNAAVQMRNMVRTLGNVYWVVAGIVGVIALLLSPLLARYWVQPGSLSTETVTYVFLLLSLTLVFQFPAGFYSGGLLGLQRQVMLNFLRVMFGLVKNGGALLILIFVSNSILSFFIWNLAIAVLQAFTIKFFVWYYLPPSDVVPKFDRQELRNVQRFAGGILGISITAILLSQADKIILSKLLTLEQFGYYSVACSLGLMIFQVVGPVTQSYFPKFSNLVSLGDLAGLKRLYHQGCQLISILVIPACCILIFFSKELIFMWTNNQVTAEQTWLITSIYAFGTGMNGLINIPYILTLSYSWTKLAIYQNVVFLFLMIPLTIFFAIRYGAVGGALSWATINTLYFFITPILIHNKLLKGEVKKWYWNDSIKPMVPCILIAFAGKYVMSLPGELSQYIRFVLIALTSVLCTAASCLFADDIRKRIFSVLIK